MSEVVPTRPNYEETDASPRLAAVLGCALAALIAIGCLTGLLFFGPRIRPHAVSSFATGFQTGPKAKLGVSLDWEAEDREVRSHLEGYGWINRDRGIVRIPIERAMDLMVAERPNAAPSAEGGSKQ